MPARAPGVAREQARAPLDQPVGQLAGPVWLGGRPVDIISRLFLVEAFVQPG